MSMIQLPLDKVRVDILSKRHPEYKDPNVLATYHKSLAAQISAGLNMQAMLIKAGMKNIVSYEQTYYYSEPSEPTYIFLSTNRLIQPAAAVLRADSATVSDAISIACATLKIVYELSLRGVAHRNINPSCICLDLDTKEVLLNDFLYAAKSSDINFVQPVVDNEFNSPEIIANGFGGLGADMYSVALILFSLFTQQEIFNKPELENVQYMPGTPTLVRDAIELGLSAQKKNYQAFLDKLERVQTECPREWESTLLSLANTAQPDSSPRRLKPGNTFTNYRSMFQDITLDPISATTTADLLAQVHALNLSSSSPFIQEGLVPVQMPLPEAGNGKKRKEKQKRKKTKQRPTQQEVERRRRARKRALMSILIGIIFSFIAFVVFGLWLLQSGQLDALLNNTIYSDVQPVSENSEPTAPPSEPTAAPTSEAVTSPSESQPTELPTVSTPILTAPIGISMQIQDGQVIIMWEEIAEVDGYQLEFADNASFVAAETIDAQTAQVTIPDHGFVDNYARVRVVTQSDDGHNVFGPWSDISYLREEIAPTEGA